MPGYTITCGKMDRITEKNVAGLWSSGRLADLTDDLGNRIEVVCPGRTSTRPGCDFQDAVIRVNRQKIVGDIEVHVTSDLWLKHGHHADAACNGVILHVALWQKGNLPVKLQDGRVLPTVILDRYIINVYGSTVRRWETARVQPCVHNTGLNKMAGNIMLAEGLRRLEDKAAAFSVQLKTAGPGQVLYRAICRALGYASNKEPFEALAGRLPLPLISRLAAGSLIHKQAVLLGAAGLLPSQIGVNGDHGRDDYVVQLENTWSSLSRNLVPGKASDWSLSPVRPLNHPARRIAALSCLLHRYEVSGLLQGLENLAGSAGGAGSLVDGLRVKVNEGPRAAAVIEHYGAMVQVAAPSCCHTPGLYLRLTAMPVEKGSVMTVRKAPAVLIGKGRADEIAVNVVLPFFTALARSRRDTRLENRVLSTYLSYPVLPSNELTRYMSGILLRCWNGKMDACRQQGLIRIYHQYCRTKDCDCCPVFISRKPARA